MHLPQRFAGILPAGNTAFQSGQGGNFQAFTGDILRSIFSEKFLQGVTAPGSLRTVAEGRGHNKRKDIHVHGIIPHFGNSKAQAGGIRLTAGFAVQLLYAGS